MGQMGFYDFDRRLEAISAKGDPLELIKTTVPWESFQAKIEAVTHPKPEERKSTAGRKPYDAILMFKILVLQTLHNLADEQLEYLIRDRLSFWRRRATRATSIAGPGATAHSQRASRLATRRARDCAPASSMCLAISTPRWAARLSAPSASCGPGPRSGS
jgi:hypothetical protein